MNAPVNWSKYATQYDNMASLNPAYIELKEEVVRIFQQHAVHGKGAILDLGAGTGNFTELLAELLPGRRIIAVDNNNDMLTLTREKLRPFESRTATVACDAREVKEFVSEPVSATIMVHSLYAMRAKQDPFRPQRIIQMVHDLLEPGGLIVVIDAGRLMKVFNWTLYALNHTYKRTGSVRATFSALLKNREVLRQNRQVSRLQKQGEFFTHNLEQLENTIAGAGFQILESSDHLYRGIDDLVVARKSP